MNYRIPDDLHDRLRLVAVVNGRTIKAEVETALRAWVDREMRRPDWARRVEAST